MSFDKFAKKSLWSKESKVRTDSSNTNIMYVVVIFREIAVHFVTYQNELGDGSVPISTYAGNVSSLHV